MLSSERLRLPLQPSAGELIILEVRLHGSTDLLVRLVQPCLLLGREHRLVNQLAAVRHHGDMLEAEEGFVPEGVLRLDLAHDRQVLDADAVGTILVITRFDRQHIARRKGHVGILLPGADADRTLVHVEEGAYTVARTVPIVEALLLLKS